jgi:hypothetical protein
VKRINAVIYGLFGIGGILYGAVALLFPVRLVSDAAQSFPAKNPVLVQFEDSCIRHYQPSLDGFPAGLLDQRF